MSNKICLKVKIKVLVVAMMLFAVGCSESREDKYLRLQQEKEALISELSDIDIEIKAAAVEALGPSFKRWKLDELKKLESAEIKSLGTVESSSLLRPFGALSRELLRNPVSEDGLSKALEGVAREADSKFTTLLGSIGDLRVLRLDLQLFIPKAVAVVRKQLDEINWKESEIRLKRSNEINALEEKKLEVEKTLRAMERT